MASDLQEECECEEGGDAAWMATFADLSTLLLTFFVLLLSFANMDVVEFKMMLGSVREAMGVQHRHPGQIMGMTTSIVELSERESTNKITILEQDMMEQVKKLVEKSELEGQVEVGIGERGVVVTVKDQLLFRPGRARLRKGAAKALEIIGELSRQVDLPLWIEGHTDNVPIRTRRFPSNWELSAARAAAALRHLVANEKMKPKRIRIAGYADTKPVATNKTREGRQKNRRVEFVFVRPAVKTVEQMKKDKAKREKAKREKAEREKAEREKAEAMKRSGVAPPLPPEPSSGANLIDLDLAREHREAMRRRQAATATTAP